MYSYKRVVSGCFWNHRSSALVDGVLFWSGLGWGYGMTERSRGDIDYE